MKLTIVSQTLPGLNDSAKVNVVKNYFRPLIPNIDILCVQEHKLWGARLLALKDTIWPRAAFYAQEVALGYRHVLGEQGDGKEGICTWISLDIQHLVTDTGHSRCGRAQWLHLSGIPGGDLNIINIYASTNVAERVSMWDELSRVLPRDCRSVLLGDFNFVENKEDKSSLCGRLISDRKRLIFMQLKMELGVTDEFPPTNTIKYSWDNRRNDGVRILERLDRIYSFQALTPGIEAVEDYHIKGDSAHSVHLAVWCKLRLL
jgi:exonuclease III